MLLGGAVGGGLAVLLGGGLAEGEAVRGRSVPVHEPRGREATLLTASEVTVACGPSVGFSHRATRI